MLNDKNNGIYKMGVSYLKAKFGLKSTAYQNELQDILLASQTEGVDVEGDPYLLFDQISTRDENHDSKMTLLLFNLLGCSIILPLINFLFYSRLDFNVIEIVLSSILVSASSSINSWLARKLRLKFAINFAIVAVFIVFFYLPENTLILSFWQGISITIITLVLTSLVYLLITRHQSGYSSFDEGLFSKVEKRLSKKYQGQQLHQHLLCEFRINQALAVIFWCVFLLLFFRNTSILYNGSLTIALALSYVLCLGFLLFTVEGIVSSINIINFLKTYGMKETVESKKV